MKTTKSERDALRKRAEHKAQTQNMGIGGGQFVISARGLLRLLDDADCCEELEEERNALLLERKYAYQAYASMVVALHPSGQRISALESALRKVDEIERYDIDVDPDGVMEITRHSDFPDVDLSSYKGGEWVKWSDLNAACAEVKK
jgi:hypothetical protein